MPQHSESSLAQIQQLYNRVNDYLRKNLAAIRLAAAAAASSHNPAERQRHLDVLEQLKSSRLVLLGLHARVFELEQQYAASHRSPTEAERRLVSGTRSANALVRSINNIADTLGKVAEFVGIITRLVEIF